jgi:hypothetical protein
VTSFMVTPGAVLKEHHIGNPGALKSLLGRNDAAAARPFHFGAAEIVRHL